MVLENFYEITSRETSDDNSSFDILIKVNSSHPIFKGHFPDNPVMPGVCMIQIIKEITEEITGSKLFMQKCTNVKFMAMIDPGINEILQLLLNVSQVDGLVKVKNTTKFDDTVALKMSAEYRVMT